MTRWLVTGVGGMLATELLEVLDEAGMDVTALTIADLDITDQAAVEAAVPRHDVVANLAAWTDVDGAEGAEDEAYRVNALGPALIARACAASGARLIHLSTDYVFDGTALQPYDEVATPHPINAYGRTKLAGEVAVQHLHGKGSIVLRTSWLYGAHGRNFVSTMVRLAKEREYVDVVVDQRGQPTWARDVASRIVEMVIHETPPGVYHATSSGETTWFGLAQAIFEALDLDPQRVRPVTSDAYRRAAARPNYSVLGHDRWAQVGLAPLRGWHEALTAAIPSLLSTFHDPE